MAEPERQVDNTDPPDNADTPENIDQTETTCTCFEQNVGKVMSVCTDWHCTCFWVGLFIILLLSIIAQLTGSMEMTLDIESAWEVRLEQTDHYNAWNSAVDEANSVDRRLSILNLSNVHSEQLSQRYPPNDGRNDLQTQLLPLILGASQRSLPGRKKTREIRRLEEEEECEKEDGCDACPDDLSNLYILYNHEDGLFLPERLQDMCKLEKGVAQSSYCEPQRGLYGSCVLASPVVHFYGSMTPGYLYGIQGRGLPLTLKEVNLTEFGDAMILNSTVAVQVDWMKFPSHGLLSWENAKVMKNMTVTVEHVEEIQANLQLCRANQSEAQNVSCTEAENFDRIIGDIVFPAQETLWDYDWSCDRLDQNHIAGVISTMHQDIANKSTQSLYAPLVTSEFASEQQTVNSKAMYRARECDMKEIVFDIIGKQFDPELSYGMFKSAYMGDTGDSNRFKEYNSIGVRLFYDGAASNEFQMMLQPDFYAAIGSFFMVFFIMWGYMRSFFLASFGMLQILLSLLISALIYRQVIMIPYFEFLHVLIVYLVLGIGADDIFVLVDSFKHYSAEYWALREVGVEETTEELKEILTKTYMRTASAVFNTSFTTAMAFVVCTASEVMPMSSCSVYAAVCIIANYIMTITFFTTVLINWHIYFNKKSCITVWRNCCCCCCRKAANLAADIVSGPSALTTDEESKKRVTNGEANPRIGWRKRGLVETFMVEWYCPLLTYNVRGFKPVSVFLIAVCLATTIQGTYHTLQLTPPRTQEQWFPANHMFNGIWDFMVKQYYSAPYERYATTVFFWGIEGLDKSNFDPYDPDDFKGDVMWDANFDLTTKEAQESLLKTCEEMRTHKCDLVGCSNAGYDTLMLSTIDTSYSCFLEDIMDWLSRRSEQDTVDWLTRENITSDTNWTSLPTGSQFIDVLKYVLDHEEAFREHYSNEVIEAEYSDDIGFIDDTFKFAGVRMRITMPTGEPYSTGIAVRDHIKSFVQSRNEDPDTPVGMRTLKFHAYYRFARYDLGQELLDGLFFSCTIAAPIALFVLLLSTQNIVLAMYSTFAIASVVLNVLGFCRSAMDWDLGIGEAIAGVIIIGYSVDYVVHLGHMYCEANHQGLRTREERALYAVEHIGTTIFAGAITTGASGSVMFICFLTFFTKMAILICMTIFYSFMYAFFFILPVLIVAGPEHDFGNIRKMHKACVCSKREDKTEN